MTQNAIEITNLNKTYKASGKSPEKVALRDVSLNIKRGSIFGLLGPNGAGKSTIINIMAGLVVKTSGSVKIWDRDIDINPRNAKAAIGIVPQEINYDPFFTPRKVLELQAGLYGVPKSEIDAMDILRTVGLEDKADAYARQLSGGMLRRLMVAKAMVHNPPILVLDEPTAGVDIELRKQLWDNVRAMNKRGVTIVLTTHYLEEAQELCDEIAIINHGEVIACEDTQTLLGRVDNKEIRFRMNEPFADIPSALTKKYTWEKEGNRTLMLRYAPADLEIGSVIKDIQKSKLTIADISTKESDLEDVFLQLTGS